MAAGDERPQNSDGDDAEDSESWYFDLPTGAWERQEAKNRELRQRVLNNLDDLPQRSDPFARRQQPEAKKGGLFGLGKKKEADAPRETPGGTFRLARGGAAPDFGDLEQVDEDEADDWSTELPVEAPLRPGHSDEPIPPSLARGYDRDVPEPPLSLVPDYDDEDHEPEAFAPPGDIFDDQDAAVLQPYDFEEGEPAEQPLTHGFGREPEPQLAGPEPEAPQPKTSRWADTFGSGDSEDDEGGLSAMRAWARKPDAAEAQPRTFQLRPVSPPAEEVEEAAEPEPAPERGADIAPPAPVTPPTLSFVRRSADEPADIPETTEKWDEMFDSAPEPSGGLSLMAEWAKHKPWDGQGEMPEDLLKPFDWEEGDPPHVEILVPVAEDDDETAPEPAAHPTLALVQDLPVEDAPAAAEQPEAAAPEIEPAPESEPASEDHVEEPASPLGLFDWESDDGRRRTFDWEAADGETGVATLPSTPEPVALSPEPEPPAPVKKSRGLGRLFGRRKKDTAAEVTPPADEAADWLPVDEPPVAEATATGPAEEAGWSWLDEDAPGPAPLVPDEAEPVQAEEPEFEWEEAPIATTESMAASLDQPHADAEPSSTGLWSWAVEEDGQPAEPPAQPQPEAEEEQPLFQWWTRTAAEEAEDAPAAAEQAEPEPAPAEPASMWAPRAEDVPPAEVEAPVGNPVASLEEPATSLADEWEQAFAVQPVEPPAGDEPALAVEAIPGAESVDPSASVDEEPLAWAAAFEPTITHAEGTGSEPETPLAWWEEIPGAEDDDAPVGHALPTEAGAAVAEEPAFEGALDAPEPASLSALDWATEPITGAPPPFEPEPSLAAFEPAAAPEPEMAELAAEPEPVALFADDSEPEAIPAEASSWDGDWDPEPYEATPVAEAATTADDTAPAEPECLAREELPEPEPSPAPEAEPLHPEPRAVAAIGALADDATLNTDWLFADPAPGSDDFAETEFEDAPAHDLAEEPLESLSGFQFSEPPAPTPLSAYSDEDAVDSIDETPDDPWADFIAHRRSEPDAPFDDVVPAVGEPEAAPAAALDAWPDALEASPPANPWVEDAVEAAPPAAAAEVPAVETDDPWAAIAAASGYDSVSPSGAAVYRGPEPEPAADQNEIVASLESKLAEADARDHEVAAASESEPWAYEPDEPASSAYDDVVLRAFEAHAATPEPESAPPPPRSARGVPEGFASLLGDDAAELIEADPVEESRAFQRLQGWAPQKTVRMPVDPANAPWEPEDGEAPPPWNRSADDEEAPPPPWGTELAENDEAPAPAAVARPSKTRTLVRELIETIMLALLVFLAVRASFQNFKVDGSSMYPTLHDGQFLIVNKLVYSEINVDKLSNFIPFVDPGSDPKRDVFHGPERGDIVVLVQPTKPDTDLIKRVIGLPGDTVQIVDGHVYINDHLLEEPYITTPWHDNKQKMLIPADEYFVMGDNRDNSLDSRSPQVGLIPRDDIIGKAMVSYWPTDTFGLAPNQSPRISATETVPADTALQIDNP